MSFVENIVQDNPNKYETVIESRILAKQLDMKINQYNALQNQYDKLIHQEIVNRKPSSGGNESLKGRLKQLSAAGKDWLWGVNSGGGIYTCKKPCDDSNWINIPGGLTQIEGGDKEVWGVNSVNNIYKMNQDHSNNWKYIPGKLTNISQGGGWVWGVNSSHNVYRCKDPCDGKWILDSSSSSATTPTWSLGFSVDNGTGVDTNIKASSTGDNQNAKNDCYTKCKTYTDTHNDDKRTCALQCNGCYIGTNKAYRYASTDYNNSCSQQITEIPVKNKNLTPSLVQLSCSNTHVYGLDTDKRAWRKNIDGSGEWSRFGNPNNWKFYQINASSSNGKILVVDMGRIIKETDKNGTAPWKRSLAAGDASGISTVSGDSHNENFYFTNTNDQIYKNSPITTGGYWTDIKNEDYAWNLVNELVQRSNENWNFLGKTDNIEKCKIKAVHDKENEYSSIVYTGSGNNPNACFGGIKGGKTNPTYIKGVITSLAPNGTSRLGGEAGNKILKEMKKIQDQIKKIAKQSEKDNIGLQKSNNLLNINKSAQEKELTQLVQKLSNDRKKINKILNEPDELGAAEESGLRQTSNYYMYLLWVLLVLVSFVLSYHIISTDNESISTLAYVFVAIWILILGKYYYEKTKLYGVTILNYVSTLFINPI